jgi:hypothetical protein
MPSLRSTLLLAALATFAGAAPAAALPFFFDQAADGSHPDGYGFDPATPAIAAAAQTLVGPSAFSLTAGDPGLGPDLEVSTSLVEQPVIPADPTVTPIRARVQYTVRNTTGAALEDAYLVFALSVVDAWPAVQYDELGIDEVASPTDPWEQIVLLRIDYGSGHVHVFGAVHLPDLAVDAEHTFRIIHVVADSLGSSTVIPTPGLSLLQRVPEPPLALLVMLPVAILAARRRR